MKNSIMLICMFITTITIASDQLKVGIAGFDMNPEVGIPLAGYGAKERRLPMIDFKNKYPHAFLFRPSEGVRDPIRSKVMVLSKGEDKLIFISIDTVGIDQRTVKKLYQNLKEEGVKIEQIFISATHTHSGPGTISKNIALSAVASDFYKSGNYKNFLNGILASIKLAMDRLEAADLYKTGFETEGIQRNKFRNLGKEHFDKQANFLLAKSKATGLWLGGMVNYAMHGNAMHRHDLRYSADILGSIERNLEDVLYHRNALQGLKPTILFMNGAEGDVKHTGGRGEELMESRGLMFAQQALQKALKADKLKPVLPTFKYSRKRVKLGTPKFPITCKLNKDKSKGLFSAFSRSTRSRFQFNLPIYPIFPKKAYLSIAQVGNIVMMTWPGEASTAMGWQLKDIAHSKGFKDPWVLGLTNHYLTYFVTKEEFFEAEYDSCSAMYGYKGGERILKYYDWALDRF